MIPDQIRDARPLVIREAKALTDRIRDLGANPVVIVECIILRLFAVGTRLRLAHVVKERGDTENGIAHARIHALHPVPPHIVRVVLVLHDAHPEL
jgi:hypothetical protein